MTYYSDQPAPGYDPQAPQTVLARLLDHGRPEDVLQALVWAQAVAPVDLIAVATPEGRSLPQAWLYTSAHRDKNIPDGWFEAMDRAADGRLWSIEDVHGERLLHHAVRDFRTRTADDRVDQILAQVIARTDPAVLTAWTTASLNAPDDPDDVPEPGTLIDHLLDQAAWHSLHEALGKGLTLLGNHPTTGKPRAAGIDHVTLWDAFLKQGGDPEVPVPEGRGNKTTVRPLWQVLRTQPVTRSHGSHHQAMRLRTLKVAVESWARQHCPDRLDEVERQEYWTALDADNADASTMKNHVDWPSLRDDQGRTPMMVLVQHKARFLKDFWTVKKAAPTFGAQDHDGRTLWFHLLCGNNNDLPDKSIDWLVEHVPLNPDVRGDGLVQQCLMDPRASRRASSNLRSAEWPDAWLEDTQRWWGTPEAQERLADWCLARSLEPGSRASKALDGSFAELSSIARRVPCWPVSPRLLGAFVLNELAHASVAGGAPRPLEELVGRWLDAGAQISVPPAVVGRLHELFASRKGLGATQHALLGRLEANTLRASMQDEDGPALTSGVGTGAPRRRL